MKVKESDGTFHEYLVEIKPSNQIFQQQNGKIVCVKPKKPKRRSKSYINRVNDYIKNTNKMAATQDYIKKLQAAGRNIDFRIITEKELGIK